MKMTGRKAGVTYKCRWNKANVKYVRKMHANSRNEIENAGAAELQRWWSRHLGSWFGYLPMVFPSKFLNEKHSHHIVDVPDYPKSPIRSQIHRKNCLQRQQKISLDSRFSGKFSLPAAALSPRFSQFSPLTLPRSNSLPLLFWFSSLSQKAL